MDKIKCIVAKNGTIIPIHSIVAISPKGSIPGSVPCVWTAIDVVEDKLGGHRISDSQYNALLKELEFIG